MFQNNMITAANDANKAGCNNAEVLLPNNEAELRLAFLRQLEETKLLRRQLANSQSRVRELEEQLRKLENH